METNHSDDDIDALKREIDTLRERTQTVAGALETRLQAGRREVVHVVDEIKHSVDVRAQLREHPVRTASVLGGVVVAAGALVTVAIVRARRERRWARRARRQAQAYWTLAARPERALRKREPIGRRVAAALLVTLATTAARSLVEAAIEPALRRRRARA